MKRGNWKRSSVKLDLVRLFCRQIRLDFRLTISGRVVVLIWRLRPFHSCASFCSFSKSGHVDEWPWETARAETFCRSVEFLFLFFFFFGWLSVQWDHIIFLSSIINSVFVTQDIDFFQHLEMHLRAEQPSLCGRDHLSYRSYYMPVKVNLPLSIRLFLWKTSSPISLWALLLKTFLDNVIYLNNFQSVAILVLMASSRRLSEALLFQNNGLKQPREKYAMSFFFLLHLKLYFQVQVLKCVNVSFKLTLLICNLYFCNFSCKVGHVICY